MATLPLRAAPWTALVNWTIGRVSDRAISTASAAAHNTAIRPTRSEVFLMLAAGAMMTALGTVSITPIHSTPARSAGARAIPPGRAAWSGTISALPCVAPACDAKCGKSRFPVVRLAQQPAEFARAIGVNEIVALLVDDVDGLARPTDDRTRSNAAPHIDIDHENAERFAVVGEDRRRDAKRRPVRLLDQSVAATQIERRDVDLRGAQPGRFLEIAAIVSLQQSLFRHDPNRLVRSRAIDADELAAIVVKTDDPHHRIGGLGFEFGREA